MRFCLKLCAVVWVLGAIASFMLLGGAKMPEYFPPGQLLFALSLPGIIFSVPALLITWLAVGLWSRAVTPPFRR
jgi:hypothetical protein